MDRRTLVRGLAFVMATAPGAARAQPGRAVQRLGMLSPASPSATDRSTAVYLVPAALREKGYVEGQNLVVERRFAGGKLDRLPELARELGQLRMDVFFASGQAAAQALRDHTTRIPIVMFAAVDPVAVGLVASLARPGGRITGVILTPDTHLAAKRLELLRAAAPRATRIAALCTDEPHTREQARVTQQAAAGAGATVAIVEVRDAAYGRAFEEMLAERARALVVVASAILNRDRKQIIALAAQHRLPAIYQWSEHVDEGGLMSYGSNIGVLSRRAAIYVDRLFKGAAPGELPVEQPSNYELVINRKTARALGLTLPTTLLTGADRLLD